MRRRRRHGRGAALILVVLVIAALLAISVPFLFSMRSAEHRARGFADRARARHLAESARSSAVARLMVTHEDEERRRRLREGDAASDPEGVDGLDELTPSQEDWAGLRAVARSDTRGTMAHVEVQDEQGLLDLNTCGPHALANLLGVTITTAPLAPGEDDVLKVEDATRFYSDGDPATLDGLVAVGAEVLGYRHTGPGALRGLVRDVASVPESGEGEPGAAASGAPSGTLVQDARGWKLALDPVWRGGARTLSIFDSVSSVRRSAEWSLASMHVHRLLRRLRVTTANLRLSGVATRDLASLGIVLTDPGRADAAELARARARLTELGLEPELVLASGGGEPAVVRAARELDALDPAELVLAVAELRVVLDEERALLERLRPVLRRELDRLLRGRTTSAGALLQDLAHVEPLGRLELEERLRPNLTCSALPGGEGWSDPLVANHALRPGDAHVVLQDERRFARGQVVRLRSREGRRTSYRLWLGSGRFDPPLDETYEAGTVEVSCRQPRPVNVNTAPREVLLAVLTGLACTVASREGAEGNERATDNVVTPAEATAVADALRRARPLRDVGRLGGLLLAMRAEGVIDDHDVGAILRNAVDASDPTLVRATVPFCFASSDVYRLHATGTVNDEAGRERARERFEEVVHVAPPRDLVWTIDSQRDLTDRLYVRGSGRSRDRRAAGVDALFLAGRWGSLVQTRPVYLGPYRATPGLLPSASHAPDEGDLLPLLWREPELPSGSSQAPEFTDTPPPPPRPPEPVRPASSGGWTGPPPPPPPPPPLPEYPHGESLPPPIEQVRLSPAPAPRGIAVDGLAAALAAVPVLAPIRAGTGRWAGPVWRQTAPGPLPAGVEPPAPDEGQNVSPARRAFFVSGGPQLGALWQESFDGDLEGVALADAHLTRDAVSARWFAREDWSAQGGLGPGALRFWFRLDEVPAPGTRSFLLDGGRGPERDRLSLALHGPDELVLEVKDETLDPRTTALRYRLEEPLRAGEWYHVAAFWKGSDKGDLALALDGRFGGEETLGSRLAKPVDAWTDRLEVEDATRFAPSGWVRVGSSRWESAGVFDERGIAETGLDASDRCEVLRYERIEGNTLVLERRPVRSLQWLAHLDVPLVRVEWRDLETGDAIVLAERVPERGRRPRRGSGRAYQFVHAADDEPLSEVLGYPHDAGTYVVPFGYRSWIKNERAGFADTIRRGGGALTDPLPAHTPVTLLYAPVAGYTPEAALEPDFDRFPELVSATATELPVLWAGAYPDAPGAAGGVVGGWPSEGVVRVTSTKLTAAGPIRSVERILYRGLDARRGVLLNCARGVEGTAPAPHFLFDPVALESIRLTDDASDYPPRATLDDPRVYVSVNGVDRASVEWLSTQSASDPALRGRGVLLLPSIDSLAADRGQLPRPPITFELVARLLEARGDLGAAPGQLTVRDPTSPDSGQPYAEVLKRFETWSVARAQKGTARPEGAGHAQDTRVVPTFAVREADRRESGAGDVVTVTDESGVEPEREERRIAHGAVSQAGVDLALGGRTWVGDTCDGWLVAFDDFVSRPFHGRDHARLAQWPVGNLGSVPSVAFGRTPVAADERPLKGRVDEVASLQLDERVYAFPVDAEQDRGLGRGHQWQPGSVFHGDGESIAVLEAKKVAVRARPGAWSVLTLLRGVVGTTPRAHSRETPLWRMAWPDTAVVNGSPGAGGRTLPVNHAPPLATRRDGYVGVDRGQGGGFVELLPYAEVSAGTLRRPVDLFDHGVFRGAFGSGRVDLSPLDLLVDVPARHHDRHDSSVSSLEGVFFQASRELPGSFLLSVDWDERLPTPWCDVVVQVRVNGAPDWSDPSIRRFDDPRADNALLVAADRVELRVSLTFKPGAFANGAWKRGAEVTALRLRYRQATRTLRREERVD